MKLRSERAPRARVTDATCRSCGRTQDVEWPYGAWYLGAEWSVPCVACGASIAVSAPEPES